MTEIKIEKGVPLPDHKYPWREMEVGDSFVAPVTKAQVQGMYVSAKRSANISITVRKQPDGTYRVWRIEGRPKKKQP